LHRDSTGERLRTLSRALHEHQPRLGAGDFDRASVALVVRPDGDAFDLLLIKRATRADDPWSGHMALPGGRSGPADADARATAERETWEEVGVDLRENGTLLGRLDDVQPRPDAPQILVSAFVFQVPSSTEAIWNYEVDTAVWIPLAQLAAPGAVTEYLHPVSSGGDLRFPALSCQGHVIWGITFRIITQFLALVEGT
jgi:8-oxo-dGTP pyrophosphatase MutT (NUDIX family)